MVPADTPKISVVMPVHNAMPHLDAAVESVLAQTFGDFEFVILDDASTDGSTERLREWAVRDPRIRLIEVKKNLGPALSSERVARAALAPIVARMDADDISYPDRLAVQFEILQRYPDVGVVGGLYDIIDSDGRKIRGAERWRLGQPASVPPFGNGPMMYRRRVFELAGGYRKQCEFWEDHDLIFRMAAIAKVMVVPRAIYQVRQSRSGTRFASEQERVEQALNTMYRARARVDQGQSYDDLLESPAEPGRKLDPRVFISMGSIILWAGDRPRLLRRLIQKGELRRDIHTLSSLVWATWAGLEPHSLRAFIRMLVFGRNLRAGISGRSDDPVLWSSPSRQKVSEQVTVPAE